MLRGLLDNGTTVYAAASTFDQIQAFMEGRINKVWQVILVSFIYL